MKKGSCNVKTTDPVGMRIKDLMAQYSGVCELARLTGTSENAVYNWIKGLERPRGEQLEKLADALHTTPEELLRIDSAPVHLTLDDIVNLTVSTYSGTPWNSYGKLKSYMDTHGGRLPPVEK